MVCKYRVTSIILICFWLLNPTSSVAQQKRSICILDFESRSLSPLEVTALTDRLSAAIVETGRIVVPSRRQVEAILNAQNFRFTSNEDAIYVGQFLGVNSVLGGSVGRIGPIYTVDIRIIDVQRSQIIYSLWRDVSGEIDDLLAEMDAIAGDIVDGLTGGENQTIQSLPDIQPIDTDPSLKTNVAVITLDAIGISSSDCLSLTNRLRIELFNTGAFRLVERGEMDEIFAEIGFQETGCTSSECIVQAGQLLNVAQIVAGSISKVGNVYSTEIRLIDVETSEIVAANVEDIYGPIETVLTEGMRSIASKLVR